MIEPKDLPALSREELLALVAELQRQMAELRASNEALHAEIDQLKRGGKRQAAPFSKSTQVAEPQSPGRKQGSGTLRGWRVGGAPAHLMACETAVATVYPIRPHHRHAAVQEVIPAEYAGAW